MKDWGWGVEDIVEKRGRRMGRAGFVVSDGVSHVGDFVGLRGDGRCAARAAAFVWRVGGFVGFDVTRVVKGIYQLPH